MANYTDFPHLAGESAEFIALADAEAVVGAVTIPLHSHILAKASKVCAQLFSSLSDGPSSPKAGSINVGPLFADEPIEVVLLLVLLMYNPGSECVRQVFVLDRWGMQDVPPAATLVENPDITQQLLQAVVRLADKLDVLGVLDAVDALATGDWPTADTLGWFIESRRMDLNRIVSTTLYSLARHLARRSPYIAHAAQAVMITEMLRDRRWLEMEPAAMLQVMEAISAFHLAGAPATSNPFPLPPRGERGWTTPGDLLEATVPRSQSAGVVYAVPPDLLGLEELQLAQAEADYDDEWDEEDSEEDSEYTTDDDDSVYSSTDEEEEGHGGAGGNGHPWG